MPASLVRVGWAMTIRVIPRIDVKGPNLVKGVHLEGLRVLGRPERFARHYYEHGADELIYMDVVASLYGRNSLLDLVERTARTVFVPLTVGGGLRSVEGIRDVLRAGADKVALNTAVLDDPELISGAARRFGSSTIVVSVEAVRQSDGRWEAMTDSGRESSGVDAVGWAARAAELGAGEIMITSVDREGTGRGFDLELVDAITRATNVPVIAAGGAGRSDDVVAAAELDVSAVSIASMLHYGIASSLATHDDIEHEGNVEYLRDAAVPTRFEVTTVEDLKEALVEAGFVVRPTADAADAP